MVLFFALALTAQAPNLIENGDFHRPWAENWRGFEASSPNVAIVPTTASSFSHAIRIQSNPGTNSSPWDVQFGQIIQKPVAKGDVIYFKAWMRSPDRMPVGFVYELNQPPHEKTIYEQVKPTSEWKQYRFAAKALNSYPAGGSEAKFFLGYAKGTVEIAQIRVENHGPGDPGKFDQTIDYWGGATHNEDWKKAAFERIEKYRKADVTINVVDSAGRPVTNASIKLEMKRHSFRFGTAVVAGRINGNSSEDVKYRQVLEDNFNTAVFENDMKWYDETGNGMRAALQAMPWLEQRGFETRGHNLVWGTWRYLPKGLADKPVAEIWQKIQDHVKDYVGQTKSRVYTWDVVNEAVTETELWDKIGWDKFAEVHKLAKQIDPKLKITYNDYNMSNPAQAGTGHRNRALERAKFLIDKGAPLDILGDQAHMGKPFTPIPDVLAAWDQMAKLGRPIEITEFDLNVPSEEAHAPYTLDYLIAAFSHPSIESFLMWGFWEKAHWLPSGAMYRADWTPRQAAKDWKEWVYNKWWTRASLKTGATDSVKTRGFLGYYQADATVGSKKGVATFRLRNGVTNSVEIVVK
ncbi:MAG: endo-1,4-beta-xylanase [Chlorobia bacterium]|nr:endo-1,4-beta-xylanase [Fimbriimonadaceae bacterium]